MAKMKTVSIEAMLDEEFKIDVKAGNHIMYIDSSEEIGGTDKGPAPLQYFLASLAGCIGTVARIIANQKGITLKGIDMNIEGFFDMEILLGLSKENRAGLTGIEVILNIDANMSKSEKEAFVDELESRCPISDNIINTTDITVKIV